MIIYVLVYKKECDCGGEASYLNKKAFPTYEEAAKELTDIGYIKEEGYFAKPGKPWEWAEIEEIELTK